MIPGREYAPTEVLQNILWERKWILILTTAIVTTMAIAVSSWLPDRFRSETLILVNSRNVAQEFVRSTVTETTIGDLLPSITQQILSRTRLERIIRDLNPYPEDRGSKPMETLVKQLTEDIEVMAVEGSEALRVTYTSRSPRLAMRVTDRLAGLFIEENTQDRQELVQETSDFLATQLEGARQRLVEQEKRMAEYRFEYGTELPAQLAANMQVIQNAQAQLQLLAEATNRDRDRRLLAARQLAELQSSDVTRLEAAEAELKTLEIRLTPRHPDLLRARERLATLRRLASANEEPSPPGNQPTSLAEVERRRRIQELRDEIENLDQGLAQRQAREAELRETVQTYQARIEALPIRESELIAITRDYDTLQSVYRTLLTKQEESKVAENLEQRQVGERYRILDPPREPERPASPNRLLLDLIGALGGLVLGAGLAALRELYDKRVHVEADIRAAVALPVVATIPRIMNRSERRRMLARTALVTLARLAVLGACATTAWVTFRI